MIASLFTVLGCLLLVALTQWWWRSYLNPVTLGVLAWTPAMVMLNWPQYFVTPRYIHQNRPLTFEVFLALGLGLLGFWAGCALVKSLSSREAFELNPERLHLRANNMRLFGVFLIGISIFVYSYLNSGLLDAANMDLHEVAESRLAFHIGPISFFILFMDIAAIGFLVRFLQTGRWLYVTPLFVSMLAYGLTFQKSPVVWLLTAAVFVSALHPRAVHQLLLRPMTGRLVLLAVAVSTVVGLAATNTARGITAHQLTAADNPFIEQLYIYSGATAIKNMSVTIEGYLPSDGPLFGAYLIRPILWNFVDRDIFFSGRYLEGVNTGTYLNIAWIDFRWPGFFITPFLTGIVIMLFIRSALSGSLAGFVVGAIAARATVFTIGTDIIFEPTTWYTVLLAFLADYISKDFRPRYAGRLQLPRPSIPDGLQRPSPRAFPERSRSA